MPPKVRLNELEIEGIYAWCCDECHVPLDPEEVEAARKTGQSICQGCDHERAEQVEQTNEPEEDEELFCDACGDVMDSEEIEAAVIGGHCYCQECNEDLDAACNGWNRLMLVEVD